MTMLAFVDDPGIPRDAAWLSKVPDTVYPEYIVNIGSQDSGSWWENWKQVSN